MEWITPITDRTLTDVIYAKNNRGNEVYNKGAFNPEYDFNRIEKNCEYLATILNAYGYRVDITVKTDWTEDDFVKLKEANRIRDNVNALITAYNKMQGSPDIAYNNTLNYEDMNSLEENIRNIDMLLQRMISGFRYNGTFFSGQEVILP